MQDRHLHNDKDFTDRAWGEMKVLLDEELPVADKRKKRPILWWSTGIAALVIFTIGLSFFNKNETNTNGKTQVGTANFSNDLSDS